MKVIGAGLPRTATTTQVAVLETLGFGPCYHMRNLMGDFAAGLPLWERVAAGDPDWDEIFDGFESSCDFPASRYYREMAEHYPEAKVLLSVRSGEGWVRSMRETIWPMYFGDSLLHHVNQARGQVDEHWARFLALMTHQCWDPETGALVGAGDADDAELAAIMDRWNQGVIDAIAPERLLVLEPRRRVGAAVRVPGGRGPGRAGAADQRHGGVQGGHVRRRACGAQRVVGPARAAQGIAARRRDRVAPAARLSAPGARHGHRGGWRCR